MILIGDRESHRGDSSRAEAERKLPERPTQGSSGQNSPAATESADSEEQNEAQIAAETENTQ